MPTVFRRPPHTGRRRRRWVGTRVGSDPGGAIVKITLDGSVKTVLLTIAQPRIQAPVPLTPPVIS
jgi:hypothetical protein